MSYNYILEWLESGKLMLLEVLCTEADKTENSESCSSGDGILQYAVVKLCLLLARMSYFMGTFGLLYACEGNLVSLPCS